MSTVNDQITDSVTQINALLTAGAGAQSMGLLDVASAETMGMSMFNAVTAQQNAQTSSTAAITASCAKMLQTQSLPAPQGQDKKQQLMQELQQLELGDHQMALKLAAGIIGALALENVSDKGKISNLIDQLVAAVKNSDADIAKADDKEIEAAAKLLKSFLGKTS